MKEKENKPQDRTKEVDQKLHEELTKPKNEPPELIYKEMADEAPEPLLYEFKVYRAYYVGKWPQGKRILQNGEVWYCYDWAYKVEDGKYIYHGPPGSRKYTNGKAIRLPFIWRHWGAVLTQEEIEELRKFIRDNKVLDLPDEVKGEGGCIGGTNVFFTVEVDGKRRTIKWTQCGDLPPEPLWSLDRLADHLALEAARRWGFKYEGYIIE